SDVGRVDAVLLSHDHHGDNLDDEGRTLLPHAGVVVTTPRGAERLGRRGLENVRGLNAWQTFELGPVKVIATPARHAPAPFHRLPAIGPVTGFLLEWPGQVHGPVWISGDTLWHRELHPLADRK